MRRAAILLLALAACGPEQFEEDRIGAVVDKPGATVCVRAGPKWTEGASLRIADRSYRVVGTDGAPYWFDDDGVIPCGTPIAVRGRVEGDTFVLTDTAPEEDAQTSMWKRGGVKLALIFVGGPLVWIAWLVFLAKRYGRIRAERRARA